MEEDNNVKNATIKYLIENFPQILGCVPDDVLEFGLPNQIGIIFAVLFISGCLVISITGNSLMIFLYGRHKTLRTPGNKLVINLALANFIMHSKSWVLIVNGFYGGPILGEFGCMTFAGFGSASGLCEIWTITAIAYERCRAISTPLTKARRLKNPQINCMILFIWTLSITVSVLPMIGIGGYVTDTYLIGCTFDTWSQEFEDKLFVYALIITAWLVPLTIISICYLRIFVYTKGTRAKINNHHHFDHAYSPTSSMRVVTSTGPETTPRDIFQSKNLMHSDMFVLERKLASRLLLIIIIWVIGWTPFASIAFMQMLGYGHSFNKHFSLLAMLLCKVSSVINACLYGIRLPKFRKKIAPLLSCLFPNELALVDSSTQTMKKKYLVMKQESSRRNRLRPGFHNASSGVRFQLEQIGDSDDTYEHHHQRLVSLRSSRKCKRGLTTRLRNREFEVTYEVKNVWMVRGGRRQLKKALIVSAESHLALIHRHDLQRRGSL